MRIASVSDESDASELPKYSPGKSTPPWPWLAPWLAQPVVWLLLLSEPGPCVLPERVRIKG